MDYLSKIIVKENYVNLKNLSEEEVEDFYSNINEMNKEFNLDKRSVYVDIPDDEIEHYENGGTMEEWFNN